MYDNWVVFHEYIKDVRDLLCQFKRFENMAERLKTSEVKKFMKWQNSLKSLKKTYGRKTALEACDAFCETNDVLMYTRENVKDFKDDLNWHFTYGLTELKKILSEGSQVG